MKPTFSNYLIDFMEKKNYKLEYISTITNVSLASIGHYKTGYRLPSYKFLEKFFKNFNIPKEEQQKIIEMVEIEKMPEKLKKIKMNSKNFKKDNQKLIIMEDQNFIQVPLYNSVSAGYGRMADPEPSDYIPMPAKLAKGCVAINVDGDSMEKTINNGSVVLVKKDSEVANNDIGVFIHEDEALIKRYKCFGGACYLMSDNPNYPPREIRKNDEFKVCGKVVWVMNRM